MCVFQGPLNYCGAQPQSSVCLIENNVRHRLSSLGFLRATPSNQVPPSAVSLANQQLAQAFFVGRRRRKYVTCSRRRIGSAMVDLLSSTSFWSAPPSPISDSRSVMSKVEHSIIPASTPNMNLGLWLPHGCRFCCFRYAASRSGFPAMTRSASIRMSS